MHEEVPKACENADEKKNRCEPRGSAEPFIQLEPDEETNHGGEYQG